MVNQALDAQVEVATLCRIRLSPVADQHRQGRRAPRDHATVELRNLGTLAVNGTATIVIDGAPGRTATSFTDTADVRPPPRHRTVPITSASFDSNLFVSADMAITKVGSPKPVIAGNHLTYTLEATNNGPSLARDVAVDRSPDNLRVGDDDRRHVHSSPAPCPAP